MSVSADEAIPELSLPAESSDLATGLLPKSEPPAVRKRPRAKAAQAAWESLDYTAVDSSLQQNVLREQDPDLKAGKKTEIEVRQLPAAEVCVCVLEGILEAVPAAAAGATARAAERGSEHG